MTTLFLLRHGRTTANSAGILAGWSEGVGLDETGVTQAVQVAEKLKDVPLAGLVSSPLQRCQETIGPIAQSRPSLSISLDERVGEAHYGEWTGRSLKDLAKDPMWKVVQSHPSAVTFPGDAGESMVQMSQRAVSAVRNWNSHFGPDATWLLCSHGDVIKAILADALGMHLDQFQRITVDPCSISVVRYTELRPFVLRMNDAAVEMAAYGQLPKKRRGKAKSADSDAAIGGGAGTEPTAPARRTPKTDAATTADHA